MRIHKVMTKLSIDSEPVEEFHVVVDFAEGRQFRCGAINQASTMAEIAAGTKVLSSGFLTRPMCQIFKFVRKSDSDHVKQNMSAA